MPRLAHSPIVTRSFMHLLLLVPCRATALYLPRALTVLFLCAVSSTLRFPILLSSARLRPGCFSSIPAGLLDVLTSVCRLCVFFSSPTCGSHRAGCPVILLTDTPVLVANVVKNKESSSTIRYSRTVYCTNTQSNTNGVPSCTSHSNRPPLEPPDLPHSPLRITTCITVSAAVDASSCANVLSVLYFRTQQETPKQII